MQLVTAVLPRAPWVRIGRPRAQERPLGLPDDAVGLDQAARHIAPGLGLRVESLRLALERAVRAGELERLAGGGQRGRSVWVQLLAATAWATAHYGGDMAKEKPDDLESLAEHLLEAIEALPEDRRRTIGIDLVGSGLRGVSALLAGLRRAKRASSVEAG